MNAALGPRNGASSTTASEGGGEVRRWRIALTAGVAGIVFDLRLSASASFLYFRSGQGAVDLVYAGLTNGERNVVSEQLSAASSSTPRPAGR